MTVLITLVFGATIQIVCIIAQSSPKTVANVHHKKTSYEDSVANCRWLNSAVDSCKINCDIVKTDDLYMLLTAILGERRVCVNNETSSVLLNTIFDSAETNFDGLRTNESDYVRNFINLANSTDIGLEQQKSNIQKTISMECIDHDTGNFETVPITDENKIKNVTMHLNGDMAITLNVPSWQNFVIVWFETASQMEGKELHYQSSDTIDCLGSDSSVFLIENLTANQAYTICVVNKGETTISPFDCIPYYVCSDVVPDPNANIWILEEEKELVIGLVVGAILLCILFGLALSIMLVRSNPTWLRGSKRVVRITSSNSDVMIMPPEWRKSPAVPVAHEYDAEMNMASEKPFNERIESENKYYLDFGATPAMTPRSDPLPPLPPPNMPRRFDVTTPSSYDNCNDYYYSAVNDKKI